MEEKIVNLLKQLVAINSIYPNESQISEFVYNLLRQNKIKTTLQKVSKNRFNILAEKGQGEKSILLYGHLDTVGIAYGWETNPFELTFKDDKAWGLGAWDMKGGVSVNILNFLNYQPQKFKLKIALVVDEENISEGGYKLVKSSFFKDLSCIISTEPAFNFGLQGITIGRVGRAVFDIEIIGKSIHYALYDQNLDPSFVLAEFTKALKDFYFKKQEKKQFVFIRKIETTTQGMSIPEKIYIELDSAILPPKKNIEILEVLKKIASKLEKKYQDNFKINVKFHKRKTPFLNGYQIKKNDYFLKILENSVFETTLKKAIPYFRSSIADENIFGSMGYTVLGIGPEGGNAHSANEWVSLSSLFKLYKIINIFFKKIDKQNI